jgi:MFS family permease
MMPLAGRLFDKVGARPPVMLGLLIVMSAFWMLSHLSAATTIWDLLVPLAVMGGGMGLAMMPLGTHVLNSAPRNLVSRVTSLTGACQNVVASLAVASFATLLQDRVAANAAGGPVTLEAQAASFGDVYSYALLVLVAAALMTLSLRRQSSPSGVSRPAMEVLSSAT